MNSESPESVKFMMGRFASPTSDAESEEDVCGGELVRPVFLNKLSACDADLDAGNIRIGSGKPSRCLGSLAIGREFDRAFVLSEMTAVSLAACRYPDGAPGN